MSDVESSYDHSCSISDSEEVYCWGRGTYGRLGYGNSNSLGDNTNELPFLNAVDLEGSAKLLALTDTSTCAVMVDNEVYCWGYGQFGRTGHENTDNIGDQPNEMGLNLAPTDLHMRPTDYDLDGIIDHWDTDDDNDGTLDVNDDFRLDPCAVLDTDSDGMPDLIYAACSTNLIEDLDDDNDGMSDEDEAIIGTDPTNPDTDSDGTCDYIDTDDDGDGWSDADEQACERKEWGTRAVVNSYSTSANTGYQYFYGTGILFLPNDATHEYQTVGLDNSNLDMKYFASSTSAITNSQGVSANSNYGSNSQQAFDYESYGQGAYIVNDHQLYYLEYSSSTSSSTTPSSNLVYTFDSNHDDYYHDISIAPDGTVYMTSHDEIVSISTSNAVTGITYPSGVSNSTTNADYKQISVDSNGDLHLLAYHDSASRIYTWIYDTSSSSWSSGLDSGSGSITDVGPGRSSFTVDSNAQPHVAFMKGSSVSDTNSFVTYSYYDNAGSNWVTRFTDQTPSGNSGVSLELDSNNDVHLAWVDNANRTLYHTELSSTSSAQATTLLIQHSSASYYHGQLRPQKPRTCYWSRG